MSSSLSNRVIVGLSGGVDSSVAALLLLEQGYDVHGLFMNNWDQDEDGYCSAAEDLQDARSVCEKLGITLHQADFAEDYRDRVFDYFLKEYEAGRTPNPDVLCNREIKFGVFREYAARLGANWIATGHYVRVDHSGDRPRLLKGLDSNKDQSYFLNAVPAAALSNAIFPVGELDKTEVRRLAREHGFDNYGKKDSTGICFIGERHFKRFLEGYLPARPGPIVSAEGEQLGTHDGLMYYTLGQRQGLGIGGLAGRSDDPWYVADKDLDQNTLTVVQGHDHPLMLSDRLTATDVHWIGAVPKTDRPLTAKTRYRQSDQACTITYPGENRFELVFDSPQRAVTPGQFAVVYAGDECLGGGVIETAVRASDQAALLPGSCRDAV